MDSSPKVKPLIQQNVAPSRSLFIPMTCVLLSGVLYGLLGYLGSQILDQKFTISSMLFWRFFIASLWMISISYWKTGRSFFSLPRVKGNFIPFAVCALCYGLSTFFYFVASRTTGTGLAMVVFFSYPMFIALYTFYQNQWRSNGATIFSLIVGLLGLVMLMERDGKTVNLFGIAFSILSAITYAIYILRSKKSLQAIDSWQFTSIVCIFSSMIFFGVALVDGEFTIPESMEAVGYLLTLGIFATAIPIQLLLIGLKEISALKASMASVLEPVVTLFIGVVFLTESVTYLQVLGAALILIASILIQAVKD